MNISHLTLGNEANDLAKPQKWSIAKLGEESKAAERNVVELDSLCDHEGSQDAVELTTDAL